MANIRESRNPGANTIDLVSIVHASGGDKVRVSINKKVENAREKLEFALKAISGMPEQIFESPGAEGKIRGQLAEVLGGESKYIRISHEGLTEEDPDYGNFDKDILPKDLGNLTPTALDQLAFEVCEILHSLEYEFARRFMVMLRKRGFEYNVETRGENNLPLIENEVPGLIRFIIPKEERVAAFNELGTEFPELSFVLTSEELGVLVSTKDLSEASTDEKFDAHLSDLREMLSILSKEYVRRFTSMLRREGFEWGVEAMHSDDFPIIEDEGPGVFNLIIPENRQTEEYNELIKAFPEIQFENTERGIVACVHTLSLEE